MTFVAYIIIINLDLGKKETVNKKIDLNINENNPILSPYSLQNKSVIKTPTVYESKVNLDKEKEKKIEKIIDNLDEYLDQYIHNIYNYKIDESEIMKNIFMFFFKLISNNLDITNESKKYLINNSNTLSILREEDLLKNLEENIDKQDF